MESIVDPSSINTDSSSFLAPQIIKSIIILEFKAQTQNKNTYELGIICYDNKIRFSQNYDDAKINKYYLIKDIKINVDYDIEVSFQLSKDKDLSEIEDQPQNTDYTGMPDHLTCQQFQQQTIPASSRDIFPSARPRLGYGFVLRIQSDFNSNLALKIYPFYGKPQQKASQYPSGLIYTQSKNGKCAFYGFCQVSKHQQPQQQFRFDRMFKMPSQINESSNESLIIERKMKQVNQLIQFPYDSIGLLKGPGIFGTASILLNSDRKSSKFLITCAHNFLTINDPEKCQLQKKEYQGYKLILANKLTGNQENYKQCQTSTDQLSIKIVHFHPKLIKYLHEVKEDTHKKIIYNYLDQWKGKKTKIKMSYHQLYDIAIVELTQPIQVSHGFRLRQTAKKRYYSNLDKIEVAGFPASAKTIGTEHGLMYHQAVEDHETQKQKCFSVKNLEQLPNFQFIYHKLATLVGNSGSPIFQKKSSKYSYLLGVHTQGCGTEKIKEQIYIDDSNQKVFGTHNRGVYIYNQDVLSWIKDIEGIQKVMDKKITKVIAIIQTMHNEQTIHVIGVFESNQSILTLKKYFQAQDYPLKVFKKEQGTSYDEYETEKQFYPTNNPKLVKIKIKSKNNPKQIKIKIVTQEENENPKFDSGYILSIDKQDPFIIKQNSFYSGLPAQQLAGVLFVRNKEGQICLNGFYDNDSDKKLNGNAAVISINNPQKIQLKKRFMQTEPSKNIQRYPYLSIGIVKQRNSNRYCTASILHNQSPNQPGFVITSASFFTFRQQNGYQDPKQCDCSKYIFTYGANSTIKDIKRVHLPSKYRQNLNTPQQQYYDVAIVELTQPIPEENCGLRILRKERQKYINADNIELAGYADIQQGGKKMITLYYDTTRKEQDWIVFINQFSEEGHQEKAKFIEHKFDTLDGQVGVPIFENIEKDKSYLIGIHSEQHPSGERVKLATYLYNPAIYDWMQSIQGLKIQTLETTLLTGLSPFGIFQILDKQVVVDYGVGVVHRENMMVTSQKYLEGGRNIGRIFFKKMQEDTKFPLLYDINNRNKHINFIIIYPDSTEQLDTSSKFINIILDRQVHNVPKFIPKNYTNQSDFGEVSFAISLDKSNGKELLLHQTDFKLESYAMDLRIKGQMAILFAFKDKQQYCYGFYEGQEDKNWRQNFLLSKELLQESIQIQNDIFAVKAVLDPSKNSPFDSVGILRRPGCRGTAQLLKHQNNCKYLITSASIFISQFEGDIYDFTKDLASYSFELPKSKNVVPLGYSMQKLNNFRIKDVYIPKQYTDYLKISREQGPTYKQIAFPAIGNIPEFKTQVEILTLYDIAIIRLEENIPNTHGFTIQKDMQVKKSIQIAGFPQGLNIGPYYGIVEGNMYMDSTANHPNDPGYVRLSEDSDGDIIMLHKLSTLPGNSGSAIYERISNKECRLLAIHTTGVGNQPMKSSAKKKYINKKYNLATYIHSKNIKSWINSVLSQQ